MTARDELLRLYQETDALLAPYSCEGTAECCTFSNTGREPYPTAVELEEIHRAIASAGGARAVLKKRLPLVERRCPLLREDSRCRIYASRPFGCRTFFCDRVQGGKLPCKELQRLGARIADLSARFFPLDPGPRPLLRALRERSGSSRRTGA